MSWFTGISTFVIATVAMLLFAAATQGWFIVRSRRFESALLLLVAFTLFRPGFWMDMIVPPFHDVPAASVLAEIGKAAPGTDVHLNIDGEDEFGKKKQFFVPIVVPEGKDGTEKFSKLGVELLAQDGNLIVDGVTFGSEAAKAGLKFDQKIMSARIDAHQPPKQLMWFAGFVLLAIVVLLQRRRRPAMPPSTRAAAAA